MLLLLTSLVLTAVAIVTVGTLTRVGPDTEAAVQARLLTQDCNRQ